MRNTKMLLLCILALASCADKTPGGSGTDTPVASVLGKLHLIEGAYYFSQSEYAHAISAYYRASTYQDSGPYGEYGLGVIYQHLDEGAAALDRYAAAGAALEGLPEGEHTELSYRINYNSGIAYFQAGDYDNAASSFRRALVVDNRRIEAKRNLELSLLSMNQGDQDSPPPPASEPEEQDTLPLFEYIRQKEQDRWRSAEWIEDHYDPWLDY